ncbi:MAG: N-acetylmuramoyl-L-alanine amidase [Pseudomonadota bacterium]
MANDTQAHNSQVEPLRWEGVAYRPLSYINGLEPRTVEAIQRVVIHATELPDLAMAREYGERILYEGSQTGNSGHFYIDRDGTVEQWVPVERIAHHVRGHNSDTIGIEIVNRGRYPNWLATDAQRWADPYTEVQLRALIELLQRLDETLPNLEAIVGHEDLDTEQVPASDDPEQSVPRKMDPGPLFPWARVIDESGLPFSAEFTQD